MSNSMDPLYADKLFCDKRLQTAKELLLAALQETSSQITSVRPPREERKASYDALIYEFERLRGHSLYYRYIGSGIGNGPLVELLDGSIKYDLISGIGPHYFGHSSPELISHLIGGAMSDVVMQGNLQQNGDSVELAKLLTSLSGIDHCFLSSSGAMACENALKMCFQKKQGAYRVLAFDKCFAGRTLALSAITDKASYRQGLPLTISVDYIPFFDAAHPEESTQLALSTLKAHLSRYPNQHAAMCLELVQGEGGFWVGSSPFFKAIISLLKEHGVAVWVDEVQTFGRTESLFAFQFFGLQGLVDVVSIGKVSQVCATLFTKEFCPKSGLISQTFTASTSAIRASLFMISEAIEKNFFGPSGKIATVHQAFINGLEPYQTVLKGPYGIGAMIGCTPFNGEPEKVKEFAHKLFDNGIISFTAGFHPTRMRFLLPIGALDINHISSIMNIIGKTVEESL
ncbi:MAG: aminotransferase class III-fold pyridoxal phosphate-dependent enzyme [Chlamydiales bacterium]